MPARSILDIDVNDEKFKRYISLFNKYIETLGKMPKEWQKSGDEISANSSQAEKIAASMFAASQTQSEFADRLDRTAGELTRHDTLWTRIVGHSKSLLGNVREIARFLIGSGSVGLALGAFGFIAGGFGLHNLAENASSRRTESLMTRSQIGQMGAFENTFGKNLTGQGAGVFQAAVGDLSPLSSIWNSGFASLFNFRPTGHTMQDAEGILRAVHTFFQGKTPSQVRTLFNQFHGQLSGVDLQFSDVQSLAAMGNPEFNKWMSTANRQARENFLSQGQGRQWQQALSSFDNFIQRLKTDFESLIASHGLLPALRVLLNAIADDVKQFITSGAAVKGMQDLTKGVKDFAKWLGSPEFHTAMDNFNAFMLNIINDFGNAFGKNGLLSHPLNRAAGNISALTNKALSYGLYHIPGTLPNQVIIEPKWKYEDQLHEAALMKRVLEEHAPKFDFRGQTIRGATLTPTHVIVPEVHVRSLLTIRNQTGADINAHVNAFHPNL